RGAGRELFAQGPVEEVHDMGLDEQVRAQAEPVLSGQRPLAEARAGAAATADGVDDCFRVLRIGAGEGDDLAVGDGELGKVQATGRAAPARARVPALVAPGG